MEFLTKINQLTLDQFVGKYWKDIQVLKTLLNKRNRAVLTRAVEFKEFEASESDACLFYYLTGEEQCRWPKNNTGHIGYELGFEFERGYFYTEFEHDLIALRRKEQYLFIRWFLGQEISVIPTYFTVRLKNRHLINHKYKHARNCPIVVAIKEANIFPFATDIALDWISLGIKEKAQFYQYRACEKNSSDHILKLQKLAKQKKKINEEDRIIEFFVKTY